MENRIRKPFTLKVENKNETTIIKLGGFIPERVSESDLNLIREIKNNNIIVYYNCSGFHVGGASQINQLITSLNRKTEWKVE